MPSHALNIPTLLKVYPDARLLWIHRDPLTATGSFCSLLTLAHQGFLGKVDVEWLAENCPWQAAQHANRIMDARDSLGEDLAVGLRIHQHVQPVGGWPAEVHQLARSEDEQRQADQQENCQGGETGDSDLTPPSRGSDHTSRSGPHAGLVLVTGTTPPTRAPLGGRTPSLSRT